MSDNTLANTEATDNSDTTTSQADKTYTQREVDDMIARAKGAIQKRVAQKYEDLGDPDELREIVNQHRKRETDAAVRKGEFERVIQEVSSKKDSEIQRLRSQVEAYKLETPIMDAAARMRAVNPDQVRSLIRNRVRLNSDGDVEVLNTDGDVWYNDQGRPRGVDDLVQEFLQQNPHFLQPTPSTTATKSSVVPGSTGKIDVNRLNMNNPDDRALYREYRKANGIAR